jgi:hypothetical protein
MGSPLSKDKAVIADIWTGKARLNPPRIYIYRFFGPKYFGLQILIGCAARILGAPSRRAAVSTLDGADSSGNQIVPMWHGLLGKLQETEK